MFGYCARNHIDHLGAGFGAGFGRALKYVDHLDAGFRCLVHVPVFVFGYCARNHIVHLGAGFDRALKYVDHLDAGFRCLIHVPVFVFGYCARNLINHLGAGFDRALKRLGCIGDEFGKCTVLAGCSAKCTLGAVGDVGRGTHSNARRSAGLDLCDDGRNIDI